MKKRALFLFICLWNVSGLANAQFQPQQGGAFAAVPTPRQPAAPVTPTPTAPPTPGVARPPTPQAPGARPEEQLRIVADPATNSLIIFGTAQEFQNVKNILKELDQVPRQVLLDVLVAEITLSDNQSLGVDYEILRRNNTSIFGQGFPSAGALRSLGDLLPKGGVFGAGATGVFGGSNLRALVNALRSDSRFKVLSSPSVLATDNRPARIQVGTEEPIATSSTSQPGGTTGTTITSNQIQYRNTGRIVTIIPQVNSQGLVHLQILAEVSQRRSEAVQVGQDPFPAFDTRQAETTAVVLDGETLVIGGIITDSKSRSRVGLPYLMDLPIIGRFFGTTRDEIDRTELIMLITPHVIRNRDEARSVSEDFKNKLSTVRNELEKLRRDQEMDIERMKRLRREPPAPAVPMPPSAEPARPGVYFGPVNPSIPPRAPLVESAVSGEDIPRAAETRDDLEATLTAIDATIESAKGGKPGAMGVARTPSEKIEIATSTRGGTEESISPGSKVTRVWVVQVAAYADLKGADLLAKRLRDKGYDVRVIVADVGGKTWHRVQVGELANQQEAVDLQKSLKSSEKLEQAFVASR